MKSSKLSRLVSRTLLLGFAVAAAYACGGSGQSGQPGGGGNAGAEADASTGGTTTTGGNGGSSNANTGGGTTGGSGGSGAVAGSTNSGGGGATNSGGSSGATNTGGSAGSTATGGGGSGTAGATATGGTSATGGGAGTTGTGGGAGTTGTGGAGATGNGGAGGAIGTGGSAGSTAGAGGASGGCKNNTDCADGIYCNGVEQCVNGVCSAGTPVTCVNDGFSCTKEFCDETTKACKKFNQDSDCQDTKFCNGVEKCDPSASGRDAVTGCAPGVPVVCNDGISCTKDACDETTKACKSTPDDTKCNDLKVCTVGEKCDPTNSTNTTGCVAGTPRDCDDKVPCTTDTCSEVAGGCVHNPDDTKCDDGLFCDGAEYCDLALGCQAGTTVGCPNIDNIACTQEFCDEQTKSCQVLLNNSACPSGQVCKSTGCVDAPCANDGQCDDGKYCNGKETCNLTTGKCAAGAKPNCADTSACTTDVCDESTKTCKHLPVNQVCDDGDVCNGTETCSATLGCQNGTALSCPEDAFSCTKISCDSSLGCVTQYQNSACSDGKVCNGTEVCDPTKAPSGSTTGCAAGTPIQCPNDSIACTVESCSEANGGCIHTPDDTKCATSGCGFICDATLGCVGPSTWCKQRLCQGNVFACGDCIDNDGDCKIDSQDEHCLGPCSDNEAGYRGDIPGQNQNACEQDCYFDKDSGNNDGCTWDHRCDTYEKAPNYYPEGKTCSYDPTGAHIQNQWTCDQAYAQQSAQCLSYCGTLTPNGCDCFGCCLVPGAATPVWLGSGPRTGGNGQGTCNVNTLSDPSKCQPCTQVPGCLNTCEHCEICLGKPTLPPDCTVQQCPTGQAPCGLPNQPQCPVGSFCSTGCCHPEPQ